MNKFDTKTIRGQFVKLKTFHINLKNDSFLVETMHTVG